MAIGTPVNIGSGAAESSGNSVSMTLTAGVPVGEHVLVAGGCDGAGRVLSSVTDSRGNTYQIDHQTNNMTGSANPSFVASARVTTALQVGDTITATWATSFFSTRTAAAVKVSGLASSSWLDQHAGGHTQSTGTDPTPSVATPTTTQADEIVWGAIYFNSGSAATPGTNYTEVHDFAGSGGRRLATEYRIISATGAQTVDWTIPDVHSAIAVATYKADAGAGGQTITGAGDIASAEAFGTPTVVAGEVVITGAGGIASAEAFGEPTVVAGGVLIVDAGDIASAEAFGVPTIVGGEPPPPSSGGRVPRLPTRPDLPWL